MSLLRHDAWIDGRTGEQHVAYSDESPNAHAVSAESWVYAPDPSPGHDDGLPVGVLLVIDTRLDLEPYRLERGGSAREHGYADTHHELKAAFEHPRVTRERVAEGIEPPERGRRLALYDAIARWIGHVEREWRVPDLGEVMIGPADECLEPVLLDLHYERSVALSHQCHHWLRGTYQRIPESAAREAERCLRAALDTCRHALWLSLDDQIGAIKARENSASLVSPDGMDALLCASWLLEPSYAHAKDHPVLWRPVVDMASSAECVRLEMRPGNPEAEPARIEVDRARVQFVMPPGCATVAHDADPERLGEAGGLLAARARAAVTSAREAWRKR